MPAYYKSYFWYKVLGQIPRSTNGGIEGKNLRLKNMNLVPFRLFLYAFALYI